jgi:hypothetical protein
VTASSRREFGERSLQLGAGGRGKRRLQLRHGAIAGGDPYVERVGKALDV